MSGQIQCRGCFELGSACMKCSKCWTAMRVTWCKVPESVATCPECGGNIYVISNGWIEETGQPIDPQIECEHDDPETGGHRWWQSDWQPVVDAVRKWCGASED